MTKLHVLFNITIDYMSQIRMQLFRDANTVESVAVEAALVVI